MDSRNYRSRLEKQNTSGKLNKKDVLFKGVTLIPAQLLGIDSLVGSLEKGKKADLIVLKNDPFDNVPVIEKVFFLEVCRGNRRDISCEMCNI